MILGLLRASHSRIPKHIRTSLIFQMATYSYFAVSKSSRLLQASLLNAWTLYLHMILGLLRASHSRIPKHIRTSLIFQMATYSYFAVSKSSRLPQAGLLNAWTLKPLYHYIIIMAIFKNYFLKLFITNPKITLLNVII